MCDGKIEKEDIQVTRYRRLDEIRGVTLFSMILFHTVWDLVYIFGMNWNWFHTDLAFLWQQSICWTFILLSGFCWSLGRRKLRRGLLVFGAGLVVSFVTEVFLPEQRIRFGILTFLGTAMLLLLPLEKLLKKVSAMVGLLVCFGAFILLYGINDGYIGIIGLIELFRLPQALYHLGDVATFIGFTDRRFYSSDYFSLLPWIFLFLTGYFCYRLAEEKNRLKVLAEQKSCGKLWNLMGKNSLLIYLLHQPIVYAVLLVWDKVSIG